MIDMVADILNACLALLWGFTLALWLAEALERYFPGSPE